MPGACLMTSTSGPSSPLVSSVSAPLRITSARPGEPEPCIAAAKPAAIDSTETNTTTTPAIPIMATADELRRAGMVRKFSAMMAAVWAIHFTSGSPQGVGDPQLHCAERRRRPGEEPHGDHECDADRDIAWRQHEDWQHAARRVSLLHEQPGEREPEPSPDEHDEE